MIGLRTAAPLLAAVLAIGCAAPLPLLPGAPVAVTDVGALRGVADGDVTRFHGVPYAEPPVGERRWAPPEPVAAWEGRRDATVPSPACAQTGADVTTTAEDCLYLDVTAPAAPGSDRPVLVWLHGGGFVVGTGTEIDPRRMAAHGDVVVVSVEFRLGIFGYLGLPGMDGGATFGLADQQEALGFVQRNAAAFGGDPDNVTLVGESGGGIATCGQLTSPTAKGLFDRAIIMSGGPCVAPQPPGSVAPGAPAVPYWRPLADVEADGLVAAVRLGCPTRPGPPPSALRAPHPDPARALECLRTLPTDRVLTEHLSFAAAGVGGELLPSDPSIVLGDVSGVDVLSGHTSDEGLVNVAASALLGGPIADRDYASLMVESFGDRADAVLARYPASAYPDTTSAYAAVMTDRQYVCPQLIGNDDLSASVPVYAYEFADATAPPYIPMLPGLPDTGAAHASELAYLFDLADKPIDVQGSPVPLTAKQLALGAEMIDVWTTFARTGELDAPRWSPDTREALAFGADTPTTRPWTEHHCDFWAGELR